MAEKLREVAVTETASVDWRLARAQSPAKLGVLATSFVKDVGDIGAAPLRILPFLSGGSSLWGPTETIADK